jgi:hypothetical protein
MRNTAIVLVLVLALAIWLDVGVYAQTEGEEEVETGPQFACEADVVQWVRRHEPETVDWMKDTLTQAQLDEFEALCFPNYHGLEIGPGRWEENRQSLVDTYGEDHETVQALDAQVAAMIAAQE